MIYIINCDNNWKRCETPALPTSSSKQRNYKSLEKTTAGTTKKMAPLDRSIGQAAPGSWSLAAPPEADHLDGSSPRSRPWSLILGIFLAQLAAHPFNPSVPISWAGSQRSRRQWCQPLRRCQQSGRFESTSDREGDSHKPHRRWSTRRRWPLAWVSSNFRNVRNAQRICTLIIFQKSALPAWRHIQAQLVACLVQRNYQEIASPIGTTRRTTNSQQSTLMWDDVPSQIRCNTTVRRTKGEMYGNVP